MPEAKEKSADTPGVRCDSAAPHEERARSKPYDVGRGKPPKRTRFRPGQSGNPSGRPKGARNRRPAPNQARLKEIVLDEAYRTISVRDGGGRSTMTMAEAIIRSLAVNAARGDPRSQRLFTNLLMTTERENRRLHDQYLEAAIAYKNEWKRELIRRKHLDIAGQEPVPHPDHIVIDFATGDVSFTGPLTEEEKEEGIDQQDGGTPEQ